jgi:hypothetical protein
MASEAGVAIACSTTTTDVGIVGVGIELCQLRPSTALCDWVDAIPYLQTATWPRPSEHDPGGRFLWVSWWVVRGW